MYLELENGIIEKAMGGDINCFEKIVIAYDKMIYNICYRYFNNEEDAKDVTQEIFIKIYRNLKKFNFSCNFSTWAHKIAVNSCIDQLRKKKSRPQTDSSYDAVFQIKDEAISPVNAVISKEALNNIESAINSLPEEYRTPIILRDINELSYQDIAEILDVNIGTVKSRISRSRQHLKYTLINNYEINI